MVVVSYRTGPKGWMDKKVFALWLEEPRACSKDTDGSDTFLYMDNCGGHVDTEELTAAAADINFKIRKLIANATDLIQPLDSFVISKIKDVWRQIWEQYKLDITLANKF